MSLLVLLFQSQLLCLCCNWEFSFWISVYGKLMDFVMYCIMVHSFCCLLGASECNLVM